MIIIRKIIMFSAVLAEIFLLVIFCKTSTALEKIQAKITFENIIMNQSFSNDELTEAIVDEDEVGLHLQLNYTFNSRLPFDSAGKSDEEIEEFRTLLFQEGKAFHTRMNNSYAEALDLAGITEKYISTYMPFIELNISKRIFEKNNYAFLYDLAGSDCVERIYVQSSTPEFKANLSLSTLEDIRGETTVNNTNYTGTGIKVGIIDPGIIDVNNIYLQNTTKTVRRLWYYPETVTEHATLMATIVAGTGGLAPQAAIYSVEVSGNPDSELDWLVSQGVHVINASYGDTANLGTYNSASACFDYVIQKYFITAVTSAGNRGQSDQYLTNPALAVNIITVGGYDAGINSVAYMSSRISKDGTIAPHILAPVEAYFLGFTPSQGTSISAALASGCIALLMQAKPALKISPQSVRALLMASARSTKTTAFWNPTYRFDNGLYKAVGAGSLDLDAAMAMATSTATNTIISTKQTNGSFSVPLEISFYAQAGQTIRICASWLGYSTGTVSSLYAPLFFLTLTSPYGNTWDSVNSIGGTVSFIDYYGYATGSYKATLILSIYPPKVGDSIVITVNTF